MAASTVSSPSAMLPSFVELMASLGLEDEQKHTGPATTHFKGHRATASFSSVSSSSSSLSIPTPNTASSLMFPVPSSPTRSLDTDRRAVLNRKRSAARFSPYAPDIVRLASRVHPSPRASAHNTIQAHGHRISFPGSYPHNPFAAADGANVRCSLALGYLAELPTLETDLRCRSPPPARRVRAHLRMAKEQSLSCPCPVSRGLVGARIRRPTARLLAFTIISSISTSAAARPHRRPRSSLLCPLFRPCRCLL